MSHVCASADVLNNRLPSLLYVHASDETVPHIASILQYVTSYPYTVDYSVDLKSRSSLPQHTVRIVCL